MVGDYAPPRPNRFEIDMAAIAHNLGQIRRQQIFYDELTHKLLAASRLHLKMG